MSLPLISLIIPTHLRSLYLTRALDSINKQTLRDQIEIILVSDIADEMTDKVAFSFLNSKDIYIRRNGSLGPADSRNIGLQQAQGKYVMFLDDDDTWHPSFTLELLKIIDGFSSNVAYMNCVVVKESRNITGPIKISELEMNLYGVLDLNVYVKNQVHMSCYIFSKHIVSGLTFDNTLRGYEDWDFQLAVIDREMPIHLPIICSYVHEVDDATTDRRGASAGATGFNAILDYLTIYRRHMAPDVETKTKRKYLLESVGLSLDQNLL